MEFEDFIDELNEEEVIEDDSAKDIYDEETVEEDEEITEEDTITVGEAVRKIKDYETTYEDLKYGMMMLRWKMGKILSRVEIKYGEGTLDKISKQVKTHPNTLRETMRLYEQFYGNKKAYISWLNEDNSTWTSVQELIRANSDPRVLGPDALKDRIIRNIERMGRDLEKLSNYVQEGDMESQGVMNKALEELSYFGNVGIRAFDNLPSNVPRSKKYMDWLRQFPCPITGSMNVEVHHAVGKKGTSTKSTDFGTVPLDSDLHREYHNIGHDSFESKYGVDFIEMSYNYLHMYITGTFATKKYPTP